MLVRHNNIFYKRLGPNNMLIILFAPYFVVILKDVLLIEGML